MPLVLGRRQTRRLLLLAVLLLGLGAAAHDIPGELMLRAYLKPEGETLHFVVRTARAAAGDQHSKRGPGFLDLGDLGDGSTERRSGRTRADAVSRRRTADAVAGGNAHLATVGRRVRLIREGRGSYRRTASPRPDRGLLEPRLLRCPPEVPDPTRRRLALGALRPASRAASSCSSTSCRPTVRRAPTRCMAARAGSS